MSWGTAVGTGISLRMEPAGPPAATTPLAALFDEAPAAVLVLSGSAIMYANAAAAHLLGIPLQFLHELPVDALFPSGLPDGGQRPIPIKSASGAELIAYAT